MKSRKKTASEMIFLIEFVIFLTVLLVFVKVAGSILKSKSWKKKQ